MLKISLLLITVGILCLILENKFYQYIDEFGIFHESFFMPMGITLSLMGIASFFIILIKKIILKEANKS
jgi:hypothetical protein